MEIGHEHVGQGTGAKDPEIPALVAQHLRAGAIIVAENGYLSLPFDEDVELCVRSE